MTLRLAPITFRAANAYVAEKHRHHKAVVGMKFCIQVVSENETRGVMIAGRPVSRHLDDGLTLEVNRLCTDGAKNACSMLYGSARKVAKAMGYRRIITYTLPEEGGASLRASGWQLVGERGGGNWNSKSRPRDDTAPDLQVKKSLGESVL